MNHTINEGNSEVLKRGYVVAIFFVGLVISILIIAYMIKWYNDYRDSQFYYNSRFFNKDCSMDKKINNPTISILPTNISKASYV